MNDKSIFFEVENKSRTQDYMKNVTQEGILANMNDMLSAADPPVSPEYADLPTLFIFGLPRSGTTLLYQLVANCLDVGYVDNIIARFWLSPHYGIAVSQALQKYKSAPSFKSNLGQSEDVFGPHEFSYFWHHWLCLKEANDLANYGEPSPAVNWPDLQNVLAQMKTAFKRPLLFKTMFAANFAEHFESNIKAPLFIYIERDPVDVALSILEARQKYYGDTATWWATYPPNYKELLSLDVEHQIAGQVISLRDIYLKKLNVLSPERFLHFSYADLCASPQAILKTIQEKIKDTYAYEIGSKSLPPVSFSLSKKQPFDDLGRRVIDVLNTELAR